MTQSIYTGKQFETPLGEEVQIGREKQNGLREIHFPDRDATANTQMQLEKSIKRKITEEEWEEKPRFTWNTKRVQCSHCKKFMTTSVYEGEPSASCVCGNIKTQDELLSSGIIEENY